MKQDSTQRIKFLENLLALMPGNVFWKDANGNYLGCNNNVARVLGLGSPKEIIGKKNQELFSKELAAEATFNDNLVLESGVAESLEEVGFNEQGQQAIYFTTKTPIFDDITGNIIGLLGVSLDVTAEREAQQLRLEKEKMEEGAKFLRIAMGAIAHDLRTPLASIKFVLAAINNVFSTLLDGYNLALQHGLLEKSIRKDKLRLFQDAVGRGLREIDFANNYIDLTLANVRHDRIVHHDYKELNIVHEITLAVDSYPYKDDERDKVNWRPEHDFVVYANEFYLRNLINNLLKNALFFIQKNRRGIIDIWTERSDKHNLLLFKDTAEGIPPEIVDKIFQGYFTQRQNGTGLGLTFCKSVMQDFGGDITVESEYGKFTLFKLKFPLEINTNQ